MLVATGATDKKAEGDYCHFFMEFMKQKSLRPHYLPFPSK
jgi:hypothetical protein